MKLISFAPYLSSSAQHLLTIPTKWISDIKHLEFNEILGSSVGVLAMIYSWNKTKKDKFIEIASGTLASSFVYGDPLTTIGSLAALAHGFNKNKNKIAEVKGIINEIEVYPNNEIEWWFIPIKTGIFE